MRRRGGDTWVKRSIWRMEMMRMQQGHPRLMNQNPKQKEKLKSLFHSFRPSHHFETRCKFNARKRIKRWSSPPHHFMSCLIIPLIQIRRGWGEVESSCHFRTRHSIRSFFMYIIITLNIKCSMRRDLSGTEGFVWSAAGGVWNHHNHEVTCVRSWRESWFWWWSSCSFLNVNFGRREDVSLLLHEKEHQALLSCIGSPAEVVAVVLSPFQPEHKTDWSEACGDRHYHLWVPLFRKSSHILSQLIVPVVVTWILLKK